METLLSYCIEDIIFSIKTSLHVWLQTPGALDLGNKTEGTGLNFKFIEGLLFLL